MQSESLKPAAAVSAAWARTRESLTWSTLWSAVIVFLLVMTIARSTVSAAWVSYGIETVPLVALLGAALMAVLAVSPLRSFYAVATGLVLGPIVAGIDAAPAFRVFDSGDPTGVVASVQTWVPRILDGTAFGDNAFVLFLIAWLMWVTGAWLAWCVLRWRQPLIGLAPGAAALATNVLNWPRDQNGYSFYFLVLTFALLLWSNYTRSIAQALSARIKLTGDVRWDFWESGLIATAALIILGILLPPLSTADRTATMESSIFSSWAQLQQELNHQDTGSQNGSGSASGTTGFSPEIRLGAQLKKSTATVFTYTVAGEWVSARYFRGVNATEMLDGEWRYNPTPEYKVQIDRSTVPDYAEQYDGETYATFTINMAVPPPGNSDILFYPGELLKVDRQTLASESMNPTPGVALQQLSTIDRLSSLAPGSTKGTFVIGSAKGVYNITVETPNAFTADLESAGNAYPDWVAEEYTSPPSTSYRPSSVLNMERDLADSITAGKTNDFDKAMAIRNYLYTTYQYSLDPGPVPQGEDGMDYFLQHSKKGYCVYFATAMGDMLRLLGIPTRLVSGYAPGTPDSTHARYFVTGADAHVWVEVYFPGFGWVPFDPTPAPNIPPLNSYGVSSGPICISADRCGSPAPSGSGSVPTPSSREIGRGGGNQDAGGNLPGGGNGFRLGVPDAGTMTRILAVLLAVMLLVGAYVSRYLRPRTVMGVWQRTLLLARLAGAALTPGETPLEFGRRLARVYPEAEGAARSLAGGFAVAAYAPRETAEATRASVLEAWAQLRPVMLRRVASRLRPHRA